MRGLWVQARRAETLQSITVRMPTDLIQQIDAYCEYLGADTDRSHVLRGVAAAYLRRERDFRVWLASRASAPTSANPAGVSNRSQAGDAP